MADPAKHDADEPFWAGARRGLLRVQHCNSCGHNQLYARLHCTECHSMTLSWVAAPPRGTVYTYTIVRRAPSEEFRDRAPYVVALVDLDAGPRLMGNVVGAGAEEIQIGARVAVAFDLAGGTPVPTFTPEALT